MNRPANPIHCTIDLDKQGIQHGFLRLPCSSDRSAWGHVMIPICSIVNGSGPTALLSGANHGDEYEGPIALFDYPDRHPLSEVSGRVIIIPAMNYPAFEAGRRTSPIDGGNLNRLFPGRADGSVSEIIADFFCHTLLPMADYVLDIHSGGKTLEFLPFAASHHLADTDQEKRCEDAVRAFGAPWSLKLLELDPRGMYDTQAEQQGKVFVTTELGGGGTTRVETVWIARRGIDNFLRHAGILRGEIEHDPAGCCQLEMPDNRSYLFAEHEGLLEPLADLGATVSDGQPLAKIHDMTRTGQQPVVYRAPRDGLLIARHVPSRVKMGDCLNVIARVVETSGVTTGP